MQKTLSNALEITRYTEHASRGGLLLKLLCESLTDMDFIQD